MFPGLRDHIPILGAKPMTLELALEGYTEASSQSDLDGCWANCAAPPKVLSAASASDGPLPSPTGEAHAARG